MLRMSALWLLSFQLSLVCWPWCWISSSHGLLSRIPTAYLALPKSFQRCWQIEQVSSCLHVIRLKGLQFPGAASTSQTASYLQTADTARRIPFRAELWMPQVEQYCLHIRQTASWSGWQCLLPGADGAKPRTWSLKAPGWVEQRDKLPGILRRQPESDPEEVIWLGSHLYFCLAMWLCN
jgi:hypothetical protein